MNNRTPKADGRVLFFLIFESTMAIFYVCFAYVIVGTHLLDRWISESFRLPLGILLGAYGLYRIIRAFKKIKSVKDEIQ